MTDARDPNIYDVGTESRGLPGCASLRQRVGDAAGSHRIGTSMWDLPAGEAAYPFHFHYIEEEQLVVIEGTPLLREASGWRRLERGAVVAFLPGEAGGHQLYNDGPGTVRFLSISTSGQPDIVAYPEENRIGVAERPPGPGKLFKMFPADADVPYDHVTPVVPPTDL